MPGTPPSPIDPGTLTVTPPGGTPVTIPQGAGSPGSYFASLPAGSLPSTGGAVAFKGSGGTQVGAFSAVVDFPNPLLSWTNSGVAANVTRSQGLTVNWTGGAAGTFVFVKGNSANGTAGALYTCTAPVEARTFTVPPYILAMLPPGPGSTTVSNNTAYTTFAATGLDVGIAYGAVWISVNTTVN
ncbi:MAG: hypothetical protein LAO79_28280 [Acidobacteriia bacterium]|nr:hypothetical protein [Terriglobia bacterium]